MKKTKWFVFLAITIVAALYVFVETPNLSPLYLDGALFWAVLITAYVGSATLLKIGEFTIQLNNFSYSAKAKFPKVPAIIIAVPWVIIAVVLVVCSVFFQWKAYRDQLGEPQIKTFDSEVQTIDISQIPIVDEPLALQLAQKKLAERPALGSQVELQTATIQMVDGELVWVVPLYHSGFFKWLTNMEGTPGYIVVSATNTNDVRYVEGSKIKYHPGSYLLFDVARKVRFGPGLLTGITDYSFELDDNGQPYWVVSTYHNLRGFSLPEAGRHHPAQRHHRPDGALHDGEYPGVGWTACSRKILSSSRSPTAATMFTASSTLLTRTSIAPATATTSSTTMGNAICSPA